MLNSTMSLSEKRSLHHCSLRSEKNQRTWDSNQDSPWKTKSNFSLILEAEIQKHEFEADSDRRSIQELNGVIESQRVRLIVFLQEMNNFDEINNFFMISYRNKIGIFVKLIWKVSMRWKKWSDFKGLHSVNFREENWSKIEILSFNSRPEFRNCRMKSIVWMTREILMMPSQYAVDHHTLPINQCFHHLIQILVEC